MQRSWRNYFQFLPFHSKVFFKNLKNNTTINRNETITHDLILNNNFDLPRHRLKFLIIGNSCTVLSVLGAESMRMRENLWRTYTEIIHGRDVWKPKKEN